MERNRRAHSSQKRDAVVTPSAKKHQSAFLDPTCFLRCLACVEIVVFHTAWYAGHAADDKEALDEALARRNWFTFIFNPEPAMQTFFCLTGFLAAISLIPALESTCSYTPTVLRYYRKRLLRVAPAYYTMLAITFTLATVLGDSHTLPQHMRRSFFRPFALCNPDSCKQRLMFSVLFAHNQWGGLGCYNVSWSLAVQMQFWCMCPLALLALQPQKAGFRGRIMGSLLATIVSVLAYRAWQVHELQLWAQMPLQLFSAPLEEAQVLQLKYFIERHEYFGTLSRLAPLSWGALAALCVMDPACMQRVSRQSNWLHALWVCLLLSNFLGCFVNKFGPGPDPTHMLANDVNLTFSYVFITGVLSPLLPALTLLVTTPKQPAGPAKALARVFSAPVFKWLADITYDVFLIHPLVLMGLWYMLPPSTWFSPDKSATFAAISSLAVVLCFAAGWLYNRIWALVMGSLKY